MQQRHAGVYFQHQNPLPRLLVRPSAFQELNNGVPFVYKYEVFESPGVHQLLREDMKRALNDI